jgi:putative molybdopterin biosynthesis protein
MKQHQFLEVLDRDEAERRWRTAIDVQPLSAETIALEHALGRVLAEDVRAEVDVPGFDRSNLDGFAVRAEDTFGASEEAPLRLRVNPESIPTGVSPALEVVRGTATPIATGGMLPRGADAVLAVEDTDLEDGGATVVVRRARTPGAAVSFAGTDIGSGETVLFAGTRLTSRDTGVLAAIGCAELAVIRRPRVAILSTGDEIVRRAPRSGPDSSTTATAGSSPTRCARSAASPSSWACSATTSRRYALPSRARSHSPTSCCSRAARRRARAT